MSYIYIINETVYKFELNNLIIRIKKIVDDSKIFNITICKLC